MSTYQKLKRLADSAMQHTFDNTSRIVIISDCHRGVGNWADNFLSNQNLFFAALTHYYQNDFCYIELGDGDELWENRNMSQIIQTHSNAFWLMSKLYEEDRLYMIYGNHDRKKQKRKFMESNFTNYYDEGKQVYRDLFPGIKAEEGIILKHYESDAELLLAHGHQGDFLNDTIWKISAWLVRYIWKTLELIGVHDPTSAAKNYKKKKKVERRLIEYVEKEKRFLIAGHTHRPHFPKPGEAPYFNDGSCVHPRCITALEIEYGKISLVKWCVMTREDLTMYVGRQVLDGPVRIEEFMEKKIDKDICECM